MTQQAFTSIALEVLIGTTWVNLYSDVVDGVRGNRGIMSNGIQDFIADTGELEFTLDNSVGNSAGLLGYYSPGHANCLSGWTTGLYVRLSFSYDTWTIPKWFGKIKPDGIKPTPGIYAQRRVAVRCHDFFGQLADHKIDLLTLQSNIYLSQAVQIVLGNMPIKPKAENYYNEATGGKLPMPVVFDVSNTETTALGEFQKIATSQQMYITVQGGGSYGEIIKTGVEGNQKNIPMATARSDKFLLESGDCLLLEDGSFLLLDMGEDPAFGESYLMEGTDISYGNDIVNHLTLVLYPRRMDAAATTVLWTLENATPLEPSESITIRGAYRDPSGGASKINGMDMVTSVINTDYKAYENEDGTGTDLTNYLSVVASFGTAEVELVLTNTHGSTTLYTGGEDIVCQVRGRGIYVYDTVRVIEKDQTSINTHGLQPLTIEMKYQNEPSVNKTSFGASLISSNKDPHFSVDKAVLFANRDSFSMAAFMFLESRDVVYIRETVTGIMSDPRGGSTNIDGTVYNKMVIQGYEFEIEPNNLVYWYPILKAL